MARKTVWEERERADIELLLRMFHQVNAQQHRPVLDAERLRKIAVSEGHLLDPE